MARFKMSRIAVDQFAILKEDLPDKDVVINTDLSFRYSIESEEVACKASFRFKHSEEVLLVLSCVCEFKIHPDDWSLFIKDGNFAIPKSLMEILAVHTIGTSRGVLFCKTEGTKFNGLMIPPINVAEMMNDQLAD